MRGSRLGMSVMVEMVGISECQECMQTRHFAAFGAAIEVWDHFAAFAAFREERKIRAILIPNFKLKQECMVHKPQPVSQLFIFTFCLLLL